MPVFTFCIFVSKIPAQEGRKRILLLCLYSWQFPWEKSMRIYKQFETLSGESLKLIPLRSLSFKVIYRGGKKINTAFV